MESKHNLSLKFSFFFSLWARVCVSFRLPWIFSFSLCFFFISLSPFFCYLKIYYLLLNNYFIVILFIVVFSCYYWCFFLCCVFDLNSIKMRHRLTFFLFTLIIIKKKKSFFFTFIKSSQILDCKFILISYKQYFVRDFPNDIVLLSWSASAILCSHRKGNLSYTRNNSESSEYESKSTLISTWC